MKAPQVPQVQAQSLPLWRRWYPWRERNKYSLFLLVLANLISLLMVLTQSWQVGEILMMFWLENIVIGVVNVLRMFLCTGGPANYSKIFLIPFFIVHYGMFTLGHGAILYHLFFETREAALIFSGLEPQFIWLIIEQLNLEWPLSALILSHGFSLVWYDLVGGEGRSATPMVLLFKPYGRVIILHITVLFGGLLVQSLGQPILALLLLVVLKIVVDASAHLRAHRGV